VPWAGVDRYLGLMSDGRVWSSAKGAFAEPVAEHAIALLLAGFRQVASFHRSGRWLGPAGRSLYGASVTIIGGGGIASALIELLAPFRCSVTVVRRRPAPMAGVVRVLGVGQRVDALAEADAVILALPLVPDTHGLIGAAELAAMAPHAWLVNVARGQHVDTDALVAALDSGTIGGAALDVVDPEPLPAGHRLWAFPNVIITPHTAATPAMGRPLLAARVTENVRRWAAGEPLDGVIDVNLGY
jgi:phosphoglycerate dehydrogenase-like enzyme